MQNFMELNIKKLNPKTGASGVWCLKNSLEQFGPKGLIKPEPQLMFSQPRPHFLEDQKMNPIKS